MRLLQSKLFFSGAALFLPILVLATDYTSSSFIIRDPEMATEGGRSTSSSFEVFSSGGHTIIGENTSASFIHRAGFLYFPAPSAAGGGAAASVVSAEGGLLRELSLALRLPRTIPPLSFPTPPSAPVPCGPKTDLNCDGKIDLKDFSIFLFYEPEPAIPNPVDFNNDKYVDIRDLSILFTAWTERHLAASFSPTEQERSPYLSFRGEGLKERISTETETAFIEPVARQVLRDSSEGITKTVSKAGRAVAQFFRKTGEIVVSVVYYIYAAFFPGS